MGNILSAPYRYYKGVVFPRVNHLRGSNFILRNLRRLAFLSIRENIEEEPEGLKDKEWDNLIILDACRHDFYEEEFGDSDYRITEGSASKEYIKKNFSDQDFKNTVYITANPHLYEDIFSDLTGRRPEDVFHTVFNTYEDKWDRQEGTVLPESVVKDAITAEKLFPGKRKIIHFMQPHGPFVGVEWDKGKLAKKKRSRNEEIGVFDEAQIGLIDGERVVEGYRQNLSLLEEGIKELKEKLEGKTVVTADHGELLGEGGMYQHFEGCDAVALRKVPWDVIQEE